MRKIPNKMREEMGNDNFYKKCCLTGNTGHIEWHHNLIFAGRQVNEKFCILPLLHSVHMLADRHDIREMLNWVMLNRATEEELIHFSKARDLKSLKARLDKKYGTWQPTKYILAGKPL